MTRALAIALVLSLSGCISAQINLKPEESTKLERSLTGADRFLRVSMYVTPLFGDSTTKLLSPVPPEQVRLLENPNGTPVNPGKIEGIIAAGTPVRIVKVELPTSFVMQERVLYTPRTLAWIYVDVGGTPKNAPPFVIVLPPGIKDEAEFTVELDRSLSATDLKAQLDAMSEAARDAVKNKTAVVDMSAEALEMAWGWPQRKKIELDGEKKKETWVWADGLRQAILVDGKVTEIK